MIVTVRPIAARYGLFPVVTVPKGTGFGILSAADSCAIRLTVAAESKRLYTRQTVKSSAGRGSTTSGRARSGVFRVHRRRRFESIRRRAFRPGSGTRDKMVSRGAALKSAAARSWKAEPTLGAQDRPDRMGECPSGTPHLRIGRHDLPPRGAGHNRHPHREGLRPSHRRVPRRQRGRHRASGWGRLFR